MSSPPSWTGFGRADEGQVLQSADKIHCRKYLTPSALVAGNSKLNLAFVANLFNTHPCLEPFTEAEPRPTIEDFDAEGERESRVFTLWLNSLDVEPGVYDLFQDLRDGNVLLQAFDKVIPGSVVWRRVSKPKIVEPIEGEEEEEEGMGKRLGLSRFKAVENCNYSVGLAEGNGMHMVGVRLLPFQLLVCGADGP